MSKRLIALTIVSAFVASCGGQLKKSKEDELEKEKRLAVAQARDTNFAGLESVTYADDKFVLGWSTPTRKPGTYNYLLYIQEMDVDPEEGTLVGTYDFRPVVSDAKAFDDSPTKWGIREAKVAASETTYVVERSFDPDKAYGLQVKLEDGKNRLDYNESVFVIKMDEVFAKDYLGCVSVEAVDSTSALLAFEYPAGAEKVEILRRHDLVPIVLAETDETADPTPSPSPTPAPKKAADPDAGFKVVHEVSQVDGGQLTWTDTGLAEGEKYTYRCKFHRKSFDKTGLNEPEVTTPNIAPVAGGEGILTLKTLPTTNIQIDWVEAEDNVTPSEKILYRVYLSTADELSTLEAMEKRAEMVGEVVGSTSFVVDGLTPLELYYFNVVGFDEAGNYTTYVSAAKLSYTYPELSFSAAASTVLESDAVISIQVLVQHAIDVPIVLPITAVYTVGEASEDYTFVGGNPATIPAYTTTFSLDLNIIDDGLKESPDEVITFSMEAPEADAVLGAATTHDLTIVDNDSELIAVVSKVSNQSTPTKAAPIALNLTFNRKIDETSFTADDLLQIGTATDVAFTISSVDGILYSISAVVNGADGSVVPSLPAGAVDDIYGNPNLISVYDGTQVVYDTIKPTVTINQAADQADPTSELPIEFDVVFSEPIKADTFAPEDMNFLGTATVTDWEIENSGDNQNFTLRVTAVTTHATELTSVRPSLAANRITDPAGNGNDISTFTDDSVQFNDAPFTVSIRRATGQAESTSTLPILYRVNFNKPVDLSTFDVDALTSTGTIANADVSWDIENVDGGTNKVFEIAATALAADGTLVPKIVAAAVKDFAGNDNQESTANGTITVVYDTTPATLTLTRKTGQSDTVNSLPIEFTAVFSEDINPDQFTATDVGLAADATASGVTWSIAQAGDARTYTLSASVVSGDGSVIPTVAEGAVVDLVGNSVGAANAHLDTPPDIFVHLDRVDPVVDAGADILTTVAAVIADASATDASALTYLWEQVSGPGTATFNDSTILNPTVHADASGVYVLRLTATDAAGNDASDTLTFDWDVSPASVAITAPAAAAFVTSINQAAFSVSGTCSEEGRDVVISGDASQTVVCASGVWTAALNLTSVDQGNVDITVSHSDLAGNPAGSDSRTFAKDSVVDTPAANLITPADALDGPDASYDDDTQFFFNWDDAADSAGISHYIVSYYYSADCSGGESTSGQLANSWWNFTAADTQVISYKVKAVDNLGNEQVSVCSSSMEIILGDPVLTAVSVPSEAAVSVAGTITLSDIDVTCSMTGAIRVLDNADDDVIVDWTPVEANAAETISISGSDLATVAAADGPVTLKVVCRNLVEKLSAANTSRTIALDRDSPPRLNPFTGSTSSTTDREIDLSWTYPLDISDYASMQIRRKLGDDAPVDCEDGLLITTITSPFSDTTYSDDTGSSIGEHFSYRVCIYDGVGHETSLDVVTNLQARDTQDPNALVGFSATVGANSGEIRLDFSYPGDTSDYDRIELRRLAGSTAPDGDCLGGDGSSLLTTIYPAFPAFHVDATGSTTGAPYSYRACVYDGSENLTSGNTVVGAVPLDLIPPPTVDGFTATAGGPSGSIDLNLEFPGDIADYYQVTVLRLIGASAPNVDCSSDGDIALQLEVSEFVDGVRSDAALVAGETYSYRVCIRDAAGNLTSGTTQTAVVATP